MNRVRLTLEAGKPYSAKVELIDEDGKNLGVIPVSDAKFYLDADIRPRLQLEIPDLVLEGKCEFLTDEVRMFITKREAA